MSDKPRILARAAAVLLLTLAALAASGPDAQAQTNTETRYAVGDIITTMPTGFWTPDLTRGASFSISGGNVEIEFNNGGLIEEGDYRYTCDNAGGCAVSNREVTEGTIVETSTATTTPALPLLGQLLLALLMMVGGARFCRRRRQS